MSIVPFWGVIDFLVMLKKPVGGPSFFGANSDGGKNLTFDVFLVPVRSLRRYPPNALCLPMSITGVFPRTLRTSAQMGTMGTFGSLAFMSASLL